MTQVSWVGIMIAKEVDNAAWGVWFAAGRLNTNDFRRVLPALNNFVSAGERLREAIMEKRQAGRVRLVCSGFGLRVEGVILTDGRVVAYDRAGYLGEKGETPFVCVECDAARTCRQDPDNKSNSRPFRGGPNRRPETTGRTPNAAVD